MTEKHYNDFGSWIRCHFHEKVQKLSVDAGFTCPNRDGKLSHGGCVFCDNRTFSPAYCNGVKGVAEQLEAGKRFFARKYSEMKYLAYFQSFTNTYAPLSRLKELYEEALHVTDVVGIVIGTRPDCVDAPLLDYLQHLAEHHFVMIEYGIESANDATLRFINRGHDFACAQRAVVETHKRGLLTGAHVILGLPGEPPEESLRQASVISDLPIDMLKIHQLQVIKDTKLAEMYQEEPFSLYSPESYMNLVIEYIRRLRPDIVLDRFVSQSPSGLLLAPKWGLKNHEFTDKLDNRMVELDAWQGDKTVCQLDC